MSDTLAEKVKARVVVLDFESTPLHLLVNLVANLVDLVTLYKDIQISIFYSDKYIALFNKKKRALNVQGVFNIFYNLNVNFFCNLH